MQLAVVSSAFLTYVHTMIDRAGPLNRGGGVNSGHFLLRRRVVNSVTKSDQASNRIGIDGFFFAICFFFFPSAAWVASLAGRYSYIDRRLDPQPKQAGFTPGNRGMIGCYRRKNCEVKSARDGEMNSVS